MKKLIIASCLIGMIIPKIAGCGDFSIKSDIDHVTLNKAGIIEVIPQNKDIRSIARFALKYGVERDIALEFGMVLAETKYPKTLAAIAARESGFRTGVVGRDGERSAFQILDWPRGKNPKSIRVSANEAEAVLDRKIAASKGNFWKGVERYNGAGKQARLYAQNIRRLRAQI